MAEMSEPAKPLVLCGAPPPRADFAPCPLQAGHEGGHLTWTQTGQRRRNGVWVLDHTGKSILHAIFDGMVTAEQVWATLALLDVVHDRGPEPAHDPDPLRPCRHTAPLGAPNPKQGRKATDG
jgi:hypothetical protein